MAPPCMALNLHAPWPLRPLCMQERFRPIIHGMPSVIDTARRMVCGVRCRGLDRSSRQQGAMEQ